MRKHRHYQDPPALGDTTLFHRADNTFAAPPGGGGGGNGVEVTLAFGSFGTDAQTVVTGLAWVTATTKLVASIFGVTADHPSVEEPLVENIVVAVGDRVAGVGFTVYAHAPNGTTGSYLIHVLGV